MYRPQSQITRQRSSDIRDLQSKSKKSTNNKQYKDYFKRLIENNPSHIDSQRRLKLDNAPSSRNQLRERIEKKLGDDEKQMLRSGVVRFIKPRVSQRDYKRFKKLLEIFTKIQKTKNEILGITFSTTRYMRQGSNNNSLYQNERMKELKDVLLKLQLDEEKMLLQIENDGKQNKNECFSLQKVANLYKRNNDVIEKRMIVEMDGGKQKLAKSNNNKGVELSQKIQDNNNSNSNSEQRVGVSSTENNKRLQSVNSNKNLSSNINVNLNANNSSNLHVNNDSNLHVNNNRDRESYEYLMLLHDYMRILDITKYQISTNNKSNKYAERSGLLSSPRIYEQIKQFMYNKQQTIKQLFNQLTNINNINHNNNNNSKDNFYNHNIDHQQQLQQQHNYSNKKNNNNSNKPLQSIGISQSSFHQIRQLQRKNNNHISSNNQRSSNNQNIQSTSNKQHKQVKQRHYNNNIKTYRSFNSILQQLQQDLTQYNINKQFDIKQHTKQLNTIKQRNNQLAKQLLITNKQLQSIQQHQIHTQTQFHQQIKHIQHQNQQLKKDNELLIRDNELLIRDKLTLQEENNHLNQQLQEMNQKLVSLQTKIISFQLEKKQQQTQQLMKKQQKQQQGQVEDNYLKYYRQTLTLQQQVKILSQQNQKLIQQIQTLKYQKQKQQQKEKQKQREKQREKQKEKQKQRGKQNIKIQEKIQTKTNNNNTNNNTNNNKLNEKSTTVRQCSNTSLIYKQFERKNKKLTQQNNQLNQLNKILSQQLHNQQEQLHNKQEQLHNKQEQLNNLQQQINNKQQQIKDLKQQIKQLAQSNKQLNLRDRSIKQQQQLIKKQRQQQQIRFYEQQNRVLLEQNRRVIELLQQNRRVLEQNKKIQQQFEYIVKQKLQIQSHSSQLTKQYNQLLTSTNTMRDMFKQKVYQMHQSITQLREDKQILNKQINQFKSQLIQMIVYLGQQINSAFIKAFIIGDKSQQNIHHKQQCKQPILNLTQTSQLLSSRKQLQQLSSKQQQQLLSIKQQQLQYQELLNEFNHCVYELNTLRDMYNQCQIQKQLLKQYHQQDITKIKLYYQKQLHKFNTTYHRTISQSYNPKEIIKYQSISTQTITSNEFNHYQNNHNYHIQSNTISYSSQQHHILNHTEQQHLTIVEQYKLSQISKFKINSESFNIHSSPHIYQPNQLQSLYTQTQFQLQSQPTSNKYNNTLQIESKVIQIKQKLQTSQMTLGDWIQQLKHQPEDHSNFINFMLCHLQSSDDEQSQEDNQEEDNEENQEEVNDDENIKQNHQNNIQQQKNQFKKLPQNTHHLNHNQISNDKGIQNKQEVNINHLQHGSMSNNYNNNKNQTITLKKQIIQLPLKQQQTKHSASYLAINNFQTNQQQSHKLQNQNFKNCSIDSEDDEDQSFDLNIL